MNPLKLNRSRKNPFKYSSFMHASTPFTLFVEHITPPGDVEPKIGNRQIER
jgi:hypothetical protein